MKKSYQFVGSSSEANQVSFELSPNGLIDSRKYTLYDIQVSPQLDNLVFQDRLDLFGNWYKDACMEKLAHEMRFGNNGCAIERKMVNPHDGDTVNVLNFASNDYLNMSQHPEVINEAIDALLKYGAGAGAACNASGLTDMKLKLENEIADTFGYEKSLVYAAGFMTNLGLLGSIIRSNDIALVDMLAHASIMDGVSNKNKMLFLHNDPKSLEAVLKRASRQYVN
ncbi:MAG: aminotransferase class I/II-fold pyridoxal phosphate-dependent enzyme, partial [bacterium]